MSPDAETDEPDRLRMLVLGAHPDDAEFHAGALMAAWADAGHRVRIVSVSNGAAGHHFRKPVELASIRQSEAAAAAAVIGAESQVWGFPDGRLQPTLEVRERIIREIRTYQPDLVLTHRTCDYHPDHRAVGQAVQDASYMVTVPLVLPEVPHLGRDPVVAYMPDHFTRPQPLEPDAVIDAGPWMDTVVEMLARHESQVFEFLPYNRGRRCPEDPSERRSWLRQWYEERSRSRAQQFREALKVRYGDDAGAKVEHAEAYEISQYAAPLDDEAREKMFGFGPR